MWLEIFILMRYEYFYLDFNDYEDVKVYEYVKGVILDVYFLNHSELEMDRDVYILLKWIFLVVFYVVF